MVNSATADAFRPGVLTTRILPLARRRHVDVDRASARDRNQLQLRQPFKHAGGEGREMGDGDLGAVHMRHHLVGRPLIFLQPLHSRLGVAVLHRFVRPRHLVRSDLERLSALLPDRLLEHGRQHETVAHDRYDRPSALDVLAQAGVLLSEPAQMAPSRRHGRSDGSVDRVELRVIVAELRVGDGQLIEKRSDPCVGARIHVRIDADVDRSHHRGAGRAKLLARERPHVRVERRGENGAHRLRPRGASA